MTAMDKHLLVELLSQEEEALLLAASLIVLNDKQTTGESKIKRKKPKKRSVWLKPLSLKRPSLGQYGNLMLALRQEDEVAFRNFTRLSPDLFHELKERVGPLLEKQETNWRKPLEPGLRLAITLRYLASGDSYKSLSYNFMVGHNTISKIVRETCEAIVSVYEAEVMDCPSTPDEWERVAQEFATKWNFEHTCGSVDGKHVAIRCPPRGGSKYFNYKKFHSIVIMAVADANYNFLFVEVGTPGSVADGRIWRETSLGQALEEGRAGLPKPSPLSGEDNPDMPYTLVGDDAFPLAQWMMKPYPHQHMSVKQRIFNYRLSRARRVIENTFGILSMRFRCLLTTMEQEPKNAESIVYAACILHNLIRTRNAAAATGEGVRDDNQTDYTRTGGQAEVMVGLERLHGNTSNKSAKDQRDHLCDYYNSELGSVPWQKDMI